jgi:hypothetical protein
MILICTNLQELHLISLLDIKTNFLQNIIHMIIKYYTPILGRKHQMVYQYRYIMTLMYVFAHTGILRRKRRGIQPQGIQYIFCKYEPSDQNCETLVFNVINLKNKKAGQPSKNIAKQLDIWKSAWYICFHKIHH